MTNTTPAHTYEIFRYSSTSQNGSCKCSTQTRIQPPKRIPRGVSVAMSQALCDAVETGPMGIEAVRGEF